MSSSVIYKVEDLFRGKLPKNLQDKVFWYANKVVKSKSGIDIYISNSNLVAFKEVAEKLGITSINKISGLATSKWNASENPVLISSGSFLWINNKIIITQRDSKTSYDPLAWTTPAGRCDDTPFNTAIRETIEEIKIQDSNNNVYYPDLAKKYLQKNPNIVFYSTKNVFPENINQNMTNIRTWFENTLIEEKKLWFYYNKKGNTLELRLPIISDIDRNLSFSNPEFHTSTEAIDICQLNSMKLVPALGHFLKSINC